jgi:hypothetical protein
MIGYHLKITIRVPPGELKKERPACIANIQYNYKLSIFIKAIFMMFKVSSQIS